MGPWAGYITGLAENMEYILTPAVIVVGIGGYLGAWLQPYLPETLLRVLLGAVAAGLAALYVLQAAGVLGR
jgi:uncharacterized membrane protein YfcA